jgi:hypothetical protein
VLDDVAEIARVEAVPVVHGRILAATARGAMARPQRQAAWAG